MRGCHDWEALMTVRRAFIRVAFAACLATFAAGAPAQDGLKLFDAHLNYNQEPSPFYPLEKVLEIFRRNGVTGILATSRPSIPGPRRHPDLVRRPRLSSN